MKKKNGFTLIELLAVIVILAIIALIATPLTINVINSAKEKSFVNSAYGLIDGVRLLSTEQLIDDGPSEVVVQFQDGTTDNTNFKVSGDMPNSGTIHLNKEGKIELKVWSEELGKCAEKGANEAEVKLTETTKEECKIEIMFPRSFKEVMEQLLGTEVMNNDPAGNLRYVGPTPNNYVYFNKDSEGNPEKWRIIGLFHDEKGDQIKIIRDEPYNNTKIEWDINRLNNWYTASLNLLFNDPNTGYINTIKINDPDSYEYIDLTHVWNIGGAPSAISERTRTTMYNLERGSTPAGADGSATTWQGAIGLMYPSDYGYATSSTSADCDKMMYSWDNYPDCHNNSWLYDTNNGQWTLTPEDYKTYFVFSVASSGIVNGRNVTVNTYDVARPVLYLKSNVKIVGGKGTDQEPFELGV